MKKYYPLLLFFLCSACYTQQPLVTAPPQNNTTYKVEYLFEHEGCKVYRFFDRGNYVYFTNCNGEAINKSDSTEIRNSIRAVRP
ncbi:MAG TPA: DUF4884 domain-containing protein [Puia sp.]|nr:DUF4884 domain-containing protein [Puia sp.]